MAPLAGKAHCWAHSPENARSRAEARKRGGQNRRAPKAAGGGNGGSHPQYRSVEAVQELLERTVADTLLLESSASRSRTLATLAGAVLKTLEVGEHEQRLAALEARLPTRRA